MRIKRLPYFIFSILILFSCKEKKEPRNSFDIECSIIGIKDSINRTHGQLVSLIAQKGLQSKIDSLEKEIDTLNNKFDILLAQTLEGNYDSIKENLINRFNLKAPNPEQKHFMFLFFAYKVNGPGWVTCGFRSLPKDENLRVKKEAMIKKAEEEYDNYIEQIVRAPLEKAYPQLTPKHLPAFEKIVEDYLLETPSLNHFRDSARKMIATDSIIHQLHSNKYKAWYYSFD
ncbi:MAG: hypothetical protein N4A35_13245 [Flavobacteriales bacterium]|jgi:hypothetical protein|nr:hypothetical protein [Flavobacteriales bacterium]